MSVPVGMHHVKSGLAALMDAEQARRDEAGAATESASAALEALRMATPTDEAAEGFSGPAS